MEVKQYSKGDRDNSQTDFLTQLRAQDAKNGNISDKDIMNHLSNNLYTWVYLITICLTS